MYKITIINLNPTDSAKSEVDKGRIPKSKAARSRSDKTVVDAVNNSISFFLSIAGSTTKPKVTQSRPVPSGHQREATGLGKELCHHCLIKHVFKLFCCV